MSRTDNPVAPVLPVDQYCPLTDAAKEREVVKMMTQLGVTCGNAGAHTYGRLPKHHHHDMACLVEAGAYEPTRKARALSDRVASLTHMLDRANERSRTMEEDRDILAGLNAQAIAYMDCTPDPSRDGSVGDHYRRAREKIW